MLQYQKSDKVRQSRHRVVRWVVLGLILATVTVVGFLHQHPLLGLFPVGVDALCPFGALESAWAFLTSGDLLTKIAASSFVIFLASILVTVLFRRAFCGQVCSLGTLQGLMAGLGKRILGKKFTLPRALDKGGRYFKYLGLAGLLILTWVAGSLIVRPYDPWVAFMHLSSVELITGFWVGLVVLVLALVGSLFYDRFFCKYLCPMGAAYGLVSKIGLYKIRREESTCIDCQACDKACPVDLKVSSLKTVDSAECLACSLCVTACPSRDTLIYEGPKKSRLSPLVLTLATAGIFIIVLVVTSLTGCFAWSPKTLAEESQAAPAELANGSPPSAANSLVAPVKPTDRTATVVPAASRQFDPDLIKGRNSFREVAELTGIPPAEFIEKFQITEVQFGQMIKDGAAASGGKFDTASVRNFVAEKIGLVGYHSTE